MNLNVSYILLVDCFERPNERILVNRVALLIQKLSSFIEIQTGFVAV